jgi:hypothetical protein
MELFGSEQVQIPNGNPILYAICGIDLKIYVPVDY